MSLSLPHSYVATPAWVIVSAFQSRPPRAALLGRYNRLLSLAWDRKDKSTPILREQECCEFLQMERRQFFEIIKEMEGMHWLRSERPRTGCVQFFFHGEEPSAKNRTHDAKNHADELRIEEEESLKLIKTKNPPPPSSEEQVRKIALDDGSPKMRLFIDHLNLVFDPEVYSVLEWRQEFAVGIPDRVLGWIAKAYQERERLTQGGGPIGLIVKHILEQDAPHAYYLKNYVHVLPESFLEAVGEIEYECAWCPARFNTRELRDAHQLEAHPNPCEECHPVRFFASAEERKAHYEETHDLYRVRQPVENDVIPAPVLDGSIEKTWQGVLHCLQEELPRAAFETWVRDAKPVRYDGNVLTVGTRNSYARDWLANRLTARINQLLIGLLNKPATVSFMVAEEAYV